MSLRKPVGCGILPTLWASIQNAICPAAATQAKDKCLVVSAYSGFFIGPVDIHILVR